jgi:hypothetical protein
VTPSNGLHVRRVLRYQRGNQNPYIEEQTKQWLKKKDKRTNNNLDYKSVMSQVKSMDMLSIGTLVNVL